MQTKVKSHFLRNYLLILSLFFQQIAFAQSDALISKIEGVRLANFSYINDESNDEKFPEILQLNNWASKLEGKPKNFVVRNNFWFRFKIINDRADLQKIVLVVPWQDSLTYYLKYTTTDSIKYSGHSMYNALHVINDQRRTSELYLNAGDSCLVTIKMIPGKHLFYFSQFKMLAESESDFIKNAGNNYFENRFELNEVIVFLSIVLFQLLFISLQGMFMKRLYYVYYVLYILMIGLYYLARYETHLNWNIFFTFYPDVTVKMNNFLLFIPFYFYYCFARHFCEIKKFDPPLEKKIKIAEKIILAYCLMVLLNDVFHWMNGMSSGLLLGGIVVLLLMSVYLLYKISQIKNIVSRILVFGSLVALVSSVLANLMAFIPYLMNLLPWQPLVITMTGVLIEMIIFNSGLVVKARQTEIDRLNVQLKLVEETEKKRNIEKTYFEERNRIAADLHDDIGATLSSIGIYSDAASKKIQMGDTEKAKYLLKHIGNVSRETMNNMSDIVWTINPINDDSIHLTQKMESYVSTLFQAKGIKVNFDFKLPENQTTIPIAVRKNIYLIFKETINNIVKYAEASSVSIQFEETNFEWLLKVKDNGKGFIIADVSNGNGLRNMSLRAKEANGSLDIKSGPDGTDIFLKIPK